MKRALLIAVFFALGSSLSAFSLRNELLLGAGTTVLFPENLDSDLGASASLRWGTSGSVLGPLGFQSSLVFRAANSLLFESALQLPLPSTGRSLVFQRRFGQGPRERFTLEWDQAYLSFEQNAISIKAGRQPINLATNFYLTPNDFFSPYLPEQTFRVYKAGVDATRVTYGFSDFGSAEVIAVLGYEPTLDDGQVSRHDISLGGPWGQSSLLGRASLGFSYFELSLFSGRILGRNIGGGALQMDPGGRFLAGFEYNADLPENSFPGPCCKQAWSAGLSYQAGADSSLRLELGDPDSAYALKGLTWIFGANTQLHPLLGAGLALQTNRLGGFFSLNFILNAHDNTDISFTALVAQHTAAGALRLPSGLILQPPHQITIEFRQYF